MHNRVRLTRYITQPIGRDPQPKAIALIEYPRIVSRCAGRHSISEWKLDRAMHVKHLKVTR